MGLKYFQKIAKRNRMRKRYAALYAAAEKARLLEIARDKIHFTFALKMLSLKSLRIFY